jgi:hypothetical protein
MTTAQGGATRPADSCETGGNRSQDSLAKEGQMRRTINNLLPGLVLVRLGQELGTDGPACRAIHDVLELLASLVGILAR